MKKTNEFYRKSERFQLNLPISPVGYYFYDFQSKAEKKRKASLIFRNISTKDVTAFKGYFLAYDAFKNRIGKFDFAITELQRIEKGEEIGLESLIDVPINSSFLDIFLETIVIDNEVKNVETNELHDSTVETEQIMDFQKKYLNLISPNVNYKIKAKFYDKSYLCSCGSHNYSTNRNCWNCELPNNILKSLNLIDNPEHQEILLDYKRNLEPILDHLSVITSQIHKANSSRDLKRIKLPNKNKVNYLEEEIKKLIKVMKIPGLLSPSFFKKIHKLKELYKFKNNKISSLEKNEERELKKKTLNEQKSREEKKRISESAAKYLIHRARFIIFLSLLVLALLFFILVSNFQGNFNSISPLRFVSINENFLKFMLSATIYGTYINALLISFYLVYKQLKILTDKKYFKEQKKILVINNYKEENFKSDYYIMSFFFMFLPGGVIGPLLYTITYEIQIYGFIDLYDIFWIIFLFLLLLGCYFLAIIFYDTGKPTKYF